MTTGSYGSNPLLVDKVGVVKTKTWSGGDGKEETYAGKRRDKWNNYSCSYFERSRPNKQFTYFRPGACGNNWITGTWLVSDPSAIIPAWSSNDELALQAKLLSKVRSHDFKLAVNAAELDKTCHMISGNLRKLTTAALYLRRGNWQGAARQLAMSAPKKIRGIAPADVSGRWLELQYGWLPLIGECYEGAKALERITNGPRKTTFRVRKVKTATLTRSSNPGLWDDEETYFRGIQYEMYEDMSEIRQMGVLDPLSVAWELTPFSFVADWFIPIGTYLENLNQIPRLKGRFMVTAYRRTIGPFSPRRDPSLSCVSQLSLPQGDRYLRIGLTRTVSSSLNPPLPRFDLAGAASIKRVTNAIALAQLAFVPKLLT